MSRIRALTDRDLVRAMREYQPAAWREFWARFRPVLEEYAERTRIPESEWSECVGDVMNEEAVRLTTRAVVPPQLTGYLIRAVRHRWLRVRRDHARRQRMYRDATTDLDARRPVVHAVVSESTRRASEDPTADETMHGGVSPALRHWTVLIKLGLTEEECRLLEWAGDLIPRRTIAEWLGIEYHAARKKVTRAIQRARALARACEHHLSPEEQQEVHRVLRRAGIFPSSGTEPERHRRDAGEG